MIGGCNYGNKAYKCFKGLKKAKVLDNVNLELTSGKVYGLKGKNGSGKTMLMRVICGLISATEGTVEIDGKILGKDMTFPDSVGVLIENPAFIGNYTGFKNLKVLQSRTELMMNI